MYTLSDIAGLEQVFLAHAHPGVPEFAGFLASRGVKVNLILYRSEADSLQRAGWSNPNVGIIDGGTPNGGQLTAYPRDCGFVDGGTFFVSRSALHEADLYSGNTYANLPEVIAGHLGLPTFVVDFKGGAELVSDGNLALVSRAQEELGDLERKLGIEVIGIDMPKDMDYFLNFTGKGIVLYNSSLARILTNAGDGRPYIWSTQRIADQLSKRGYRVIEIERDLPRGTRFYPYEQLFTHLVLLGNTFSIDERTVVIIQDFSHADLAEMGFDDIRGKLSNEGLAVVEFPVRRYYEMLSSKGGLRCMTFPIRKTDGSEPKSQSPFLSPKA